MIATPQSRSPSPFVLGFWTLALFVVWSNSFIAIEYLLTKTPLDWFSLTALRFGIVAFIGAAWCFAFHARESIELIRLRWRRLILAGLCSVPAYNFALYYGQEHNLPAPVASLLTALSPLFIMLLSAAFLGESLTKRKMLGFAVALCGVIVISRAKDLGGGAHSYTEIIVITALAPLSWAIYTVLSRPVTTTSSPVVWTYMASVAGMLPLFVAFPFVGDVNVVAELDPTAWSMVAFLSLLCTVFGFVVWSWLLKHLPATYVGFTVFLNPPMTSASKYALAMLLPASFAFTVTPWEWVGGAITLAGVAIVLMRRNARRV